MAGEAPPQPQPAINTTTIIQARQAVNSIYVDEKIKDYILDIVFATRDPAASKMQEFAPLIEIGVSPRATIALTKAAKASAFLRGRGYVTPDDVKQLALDVLRHRLVVTFEAEAEDITPANIIQQIISRIEVP
jgi:MoxR-like ATPase